MLPGEKKTVTIESVAVGGDGVGRIDGMAVFVPQTCRGDMAEIELTRVKSGCAYGRVVQIVTPSPHRREGFCPQSTTCGGCNFAHMQYAEQLAVKRQIVTDALQRIGGFTGFEAEPTLAAPRPERYRNKMVFPLGKDAKGRIAGGFYAPGSHRLVPLTDCRQGDRAAALWLAAVVDFLNEQHISVYDEGTHRGLARRLFVRLAEGTREAMVVLTINGKSLKNAHLLVQALRSVQTDYQLKSIILNMHTEANNLLLGKTNRVLFGTDRIEDTLGGLRFSVSPHSFYQINAPQTERLYNTALDLAALSGQESVLDLYCGIGTITLFAAAHAAQVTGVEIVPQAICDARENAKQNQIQNASFICGSAESIAPQLIESGTAPDVVFLDPPRKGAEKAALDAVAHMAPQKIVYISCNPATLARDAAHLARSGYRLCRVIPADMFPNTSHIESCALLQRIEHE